MVAQTPSPRQTADLILHVGPSRNDSGSRKHPERWALAPDHDACRRDAASQLDDRILHLPVKGQWLWGWPQNASARRWKRCIKYVQMSSSRLCNSLCTRCYKRDSRSYITSAVEHPRHRFGWHAAPDVSWCHWISSSRLPSPMTLLTGSAPATDWQNPLQPGRKQTSKKSSKRTPMLTPPAELSLQNRYDPTTSIKADQNQRNDPKTTARPRTCRHMANCQELVESPVRLMQTLKTTLLCVRHRGERHSVGIWWSGNESGLEQHSSVYLAEKQGEVSEGIIHYSWLYVIVLQWGITGICVIFCVFHFLLVDKMPVFECFNCYSKNCGQWASVKCLHFSK